MELIKLGTYKILFPKAMCITYHSIYWGPTVQNNALLVSSQEFCKSLAMLDVSPGTSYFDC